MSDQYDTESINSMLERAEKTVQERKTTELTLDKSNVASFPGFAYHMEATGERLLVVIDIFKSGFECKACNGRKTITVKVGREDVEQTCPVCNGKGALLIIPDTSKDLPTTGVIVSRGDQVKDKRYQIGTRVLFGPYSGDFIPTRAGVMLKVIDEAQAKLVITGGEDLGAFDFITEEDGRL